MLVLGGAAFLAGRFFNNQHAPNQNGPIVKSGPNGQQSVKIRPGNFGPSPTEIPQTHPDTEGLFLNRQDNVLTIGTGNVTIAMKGNDSGGTPEASAASYSGPQVEVVITNQTKIYRDATMDDLTNGIPQNGQTIQQKVVDGSLEDLTSTSSIAVWGRKSGDRYIADVLLYATPLLVEQPPQ